MKTLRVNLKENGYPIYIEDGLLQKAGELVKTFYTGKKVFIVTDENVAGIYLEPLKQTLLSSGFDPGALVLPAGEKTKAFATLPKLYSAFLSFGITRSDLIVAFGGGVVGDVAGFAAATFLRGVRYIQMPTSLLAQVDSSVGGKVAVDLPEGKNLAGNFYQPAAVLIDTGLLATLTDGFFSDGMGEVVKYGCICDKAFFELLSGLSGRSDVMGQIERIVWTCCGIKARIVENDERDTGERMLLNFGHTIGHGIEKLYGYETYSHGQAVAAGMYGITCLGEQKGLTAPGSAQKLKTVLERHGLPSCIPYRTDELLKAVAVDKKNLNGRLNLVLLKEIGAAFVYKTTAAFLEG